MPPAQNATPSDSAAANQSTRGVDINADTGLCTDYLNHFNEAIMVLEMISAMPEVVEEFVSWKPRSYREHFASSNFRNREAVLASYQAANPATRDALDTLADTMNELLTVTRDALKSSDSATAGMLAETAVNELKPLVARAGMVINGRMTDPDMKPESGATQAAVDALLRR